RTLPLRSDQPHDEINEGCLASQLAQARTFWPRCHASRLNDLARATPKKDSQFSTTWRRPRLPMKDGEPDFRQLEPDGELAEPTSGAPTSRISLGCAAGFQETRDVRKRVLRRPHDGRLAVRVLR